MHFVRYKAVTKYTLGIKVSVMTPEPFVFFSVQQKGQRNLSADREDHSFGSEIDQNTTRRERELNNDCYCLTNEGAVFIHRLCLESFQFIYVSLSICDKMVYFRNSLL